jgi:phosphohistidine phosphatase
MRHAKSDWTEPGKTDHQRGLNKRGIQSAPLMAEWLQTSVGIPDVILASSARRARETVDMMMTVWQSGPPVWQNDQLYLAAPETILRVVAADSMEGRSVMVVGHNPGMAHLASQLAGIDLQFPTAAIAIFEPAITAWSEMTLGTPTTLIAHMYPKGLDRFDEHG